MADRHDSRTGRDEHLSPTVDPGPRGEATPAQRQAEHDRTTVDHTDRSGRTSEGRRDVNDRGAARTAEQVKADAAGEADRKKSDDVRDKAETEAIAARRKAEDEARAELKKAAAQSASDATKRRSAGVVNYIGIGIGADEPVYLDNPTEPIRNERTLLIHGVNYEHVGEDADGVWLYRAMK